MIDIVAYIEHVGRVGEQSVSGYGYRRFDFRLHQYVVLSSETLYPHCVCRLT